MLAITYSSFIWVKSELLTRDTPSLEGVALLYQYQVNLIRNWLHTEENISRNESTLPSRINAPDSIQGGGVAAVQDSAL